MDKINLREKLAQLHEHWSPRLLAALNGQHVRLAKLQGEFVWHAHAEGDELFFVLEGELTIRLRERDVHLSAGELFVVPRGVEHLPVAEREASVLLFESAEIINTGDAEDPRRLERIEPL